MAGKWITIAALSGAIAVIAGAFGAHALKQKLTPEQLNTFEVGARYHMYHSLALLAVAWLATAKPSKMITASGICMVVGIVLFCGSLYLLPLTKWRWLGPVTPLGGLSFIVGWVLMAVSAARSP